MGRNFKLDLTTAHPGEVHGYFLTGVFDAWLQALDDEQLLAAERAFTFAATKTANLRFGRAYIQNNPIIEEALSLGFGGGKSAVRGV